jgi:FkbM family methyltransferase
MVREAIAALLNPLFKNYIYTVRHGLARGLKRKGGLGFLPFVKLTPEELFLQNLDLTGKTIYDIGGFQGIFAIFFARAAGRGGRVITFEPNPLNYESILEIINLNKFTNTSARQIALGNKKKSGVMAFQPSNRGTGSLQEDIKKSILHDKGAATIEVDIDSLDNQIAAHNLPQPDFIKVDVEGLEMDVLLGCVETLKKWKPKLFIEIHGIDDRKKIDNARQIVTFLLERSYSLYHVESGGNINSSNVQTAKEGHLYCT